MTRTCSDRQYDKQSILTPDEAKELKAIFAAIDIDDNGTINKAEMQRIRGDGDSFMTKLDLIDTDEDGLITRNEWMAYWIQRKEEDAKGFLNAVHRLKQSGARHVAKGAVAPVVAKGAVAPVGVSPS